MDFSVCMCLCPVFTQTPCKHLPAPQPLVILHVFVVSYSNICYLCYLNITFECLSRWRLCVTGCMRCTVCLLIQRVIALSVNHPKADQGSDVCLLVGC